MQLDKESGEEEKSCLYGILAVAYALIQYLWAVAVTVSFKRFGILDYVSSPSGYIPLFFANALLALPMAIVFLGSTLRYRRDFGEKMDYVKTDRYALTLVLTTLYTFMLPFSAVITSPATKGAYAWFYYIFFVAFFEEFLYRGLVVQFLERSTFPKWIIYTLPALLYGLYQTALPLGRSGFGISPLLQTIPEVIFSIAVHYLLLAAKKWSGAMWLPIIIHAIFDDAFYLIFR